MSYSRNDLWYDRNCIASCVTVHWVFGGLLFGWRRRATTCHRFADDEFSNNRHGLVALLERSSLGRVRRGDLAEKKCNVTKKRKRTRERRRPITTPSHALPLFPPHCALVPSLSRTIKLYGLFLPLPFAHYYKYSIYSGRRSDILRV